MANNKSPDKRPARVNYWSRQTLKNNKVKNLVKYNGLTKHKATELWLDARVSRKK